MKIDTINNSNTIRLFVYDYLHLTLSILQFNVSHESQHRDDTMRRKKGYLIQI